MEELTKRVEKLEKENRRLKVISFLVLFMLSVVLFMGATKWNKEILTESLKVVDKNGSTRIEVSTDVEGTKIPAIAFYDSKGETKLMMAVAEDETPMIALCDSKGEKTLAMSVPENGAPSIDFFNSEWKTKLTISSTITPMRYRHYCVRFGKLR